MRIDSSLFQGYVVPPFYDSMLAKIIVHGKTREEAIRKMKSALGELVIEGIETNVDFLFGLVGSEEFRDGDVRTINAELERRCTTC